MIPPNRYKRCSCGFYAGHPDFEPGTVSRGCTAKLRAERDRLAGAYDPKRESYETYLERWQAELGDEEIANLFDVAEYRTLPKR